MWKSCRDLETTHYNIIRRMRIACWMSKSTNTYPEYVMLIAFPLQQWLSERPSVLYNTYIACLGKWLKITGYEPRGRGVKSEADRRTVSDWVACPADSFIPRVPVPVHRRHYL